MDLVTGEPLALDFVNTLTSEFDALDDPGPWLRLQAERLVPPSRPLNEADLAAIRALRAYIRMAIDAVRQGAPPPGAAIDAVNRAVKAAPAYRVLDTDLHMLTHRNGDECAKLLAQLAEAAVDLLTDANASKIRACEGPQCRMLFLPAHPKRRWCSPALCGNRVRVARYYQRHKAN
jgi:predicted RNA-binding Zn ribbon-like protein